jgi:hypothetical protein
VMSSMSIDPSNPKYITLKGVGVRFEVPDP